MAYSRQEGEFLTSQGETETLSPDPFDEQLLENERTTKNPFYWIWVVFRLSDTEIERKAGKGAVHYLSFQSYLISISISMSIIGKVFKIYLLKLSQRGQLVKLNNSNSRTVMHNNLF